MVLTRHYQDKDRVIHYSKNRVHDAIYYLNTTRMYHKNMLQSRMLSQTREDYYRLQMRYEKYLKNCIQETISLLKMY